MLQQTMPEKIAGQWIWLPKDAGRKESNVFFRNDFSLNETPGKAEIWIAAKTHFHLYVNGRHCAANVATNPMDNQYVFLFDVTYLVQIGINQIAVHVFNANAPLAGIPRQEGGLWLQLHIDDAIKLYTNESWMCYQALCYQKSGLCRSVGAPEIETLCFNTYPRNWQTTPVAELNQIAKDPSVMEETKNFWHAPEIVEPVKQGRYTLEPAPVNSDVYDFCPWRTIASGGHYVPSRYALWVDFSEADPQGRMNGVFGAEAYIYSEKQERKKLTLFSEQSVRFFVNNRLVTEYLKEEYDAWAKGMGCPNNAGVHQENLECQLEAGWNHLMLFVENNEDSKGVMMLWQDVRIGQMKAVKSREPEAEEGWNITGPLMTPFVFTSPVISFEALPRVHYSMNPVFPPDFSIYLGSCDFLKDESGRLTQEEEPHFAGNREFIVYDFGKALLGYPEITLQGSAGDIVDVVCGEQLVDGELIAYISEKRNLSTLVLSGMVDHWMSATPQGFRYIMVMARRVTGVVTIEKVQGRIPSRNLPYAGDFHCSDEWFNRIWSVGADTLGSTMRGGFLDAPCRLQSQFIADAMIQSWASYHLNGNFKMVDKVIEGFTRGQLETGELNSISPSGFFRSLPDYSLLWIIWIHRHMMYTGNQVLLRKLFPSVRKLLDFFNYNAVIPEGPLPDMRECHASYCFLDHGDIDRQGICTGLNALYCRALICASYLAEMLGEEEEMNSWQHRASLVAVQMRQLTWNAQKGLFADSYHYDGNRSTQFSWQTNVLAIYGGLAKQEQYQEIWDLLFTDVAPYERFAAGEFNNPYFKYFVLDTAFTLGKSSWGLQLIRYYWGKMLEAGASSWWELFDPEGADQNLRLISKCHGYGVSPNGFLISELVGIRPAEPGMRRVYFNPCPSLDGVTWVKATVPTPHGRIMVEWVLDENMTLTVRINSSVPLELIPVIAPEAAEVLELNVSDNITVLAQEEN